MTAPPIADDQGGELDAVLDDAVLDGPVPDGPVPDGPVLDDTADPDAELSALAEVAAPTPAELTGLAARAAQRAGLTVLGMASWPASRPAGELPAIAGFVVSPFSPLAAALADECLAGCLGAPPADPALGERTGIVIASTTGDLATAAAVAAAVDARTRVPPLLFFQSNPNAVAGHVAARWALGGPVVCTRPAGDPLADALASAELLVEDDAADAVLVIVANTYRDGTVDGLALLLRGAPPPAEPSAQPPAARRPAEQATSPGAAR